jgi:hypothetical protein
MIGTAWVWGLAGLALILALGLLAVLALGLVALPGAFLRRAGQTADAGRTDDGQPLPDEVPDATASETSAQVDGPPGR